MSQILIAIYVFELFYRIKISPVSVGHHVGATMIGKAAIGIPLNPAHRRDAAIEFGLCLLLGLGQISDLFSIYNQFP